MQPIIEIPAPIDQDPDSVVTALETAAVFASKGDATEALRWLKRAADSAGEGADDMRMLTLARSAADLTRQVQESSGANQSERVSHGPQVSAALETPVPSRASDASEPSHPPGVSTATDGSHPPQASNKWLPKPPLRMASVQPSPGERSNTRPPPPSSRPLNTPEPPRVASDKYRSARGVHGQEAKREAPNHEASRLRHAARVSVVPSNTEPGLYLVRLLEEDKPPAADAAEAFLLLVDPNATVLSR